MRIETGKTTLSVTFPFSATVVFMLLLCDEEIVIVSLFSSLFHEGGHLFFMTLFSSLPRLIEFGAFGIRIEKNESRLIGYKEESLIALGGIFGNIFLSVTGVIFYFLNESIWSLRLLAVNVFIALFNLIPVRQLDAGRCLECIFSAFFDEEKGERWLNIISAGSVLFVTACCVIYNIFVSFNISFIAVTVYLILISTFKELKNDK